MRQVAVTARLNGYGEKIWKKDTDLNITLLPKTVWKAGKNIRCP